LVASGTLSSARTTPTADAAGAVARRTNSNFAIPLVTLRRHDISRSSLYVDNNLCATPAVF
jgi:hypothetical protein